MRSSIDFELACSGINCPREFGDDSTIHRVFQHWVEIKLFRKIWSLLVVECDELGLVNWAWQAADGWLGGDQIGPNPTDRAKHGTKKSLLTEATGGPLAIVIAPANVNDHKLLGETIDSIVVERPKATPRRPQHLCLDKGYDNQQSRKIVKKHGYRDHIRRIGEEKLDQKRENRHPARRYVVEPTLAWLSSAEAC